MTDERDTIPTFAGIPMQPTGSGVADLETQREQDALAEGEVPEQSDDATDAPQADVTVSGAE